MAPEMVAPCTSTARPSDRAVHILVRNGWPADTCLRCVRLDHPQDGVHIAVVSTAPLITLSWEDG